MPKKKAARRGGNRPRNSPNTAVITTNIIPSIDSTLKLSHRARYTCTTSTAINITRANMLNTLIVNLAGSTSNARLFSGVRLKRIEIYGGANIGNIALEWLSSYGPTREITDKSLSTASNPCIKTSPPSNSVAGFWSMTGTNESEILCNITPNGSGGACTIDVWIDAILMDGETPVAVTTTASGVASTVYMTRFDGPGASAVFIPDNYITLN